MELLKTREATAAEVIEANAFDIERGWKIGFRHFTRELYAPRAKNGVQHRRHSRSKIRVIEGKPFVMHHGKLEEITATLWLRDDGKPVVFDTRIKSEYLK